MQDDPAFVLDAFLPSMDLNLSILESSQASSYFGSNLSGQPHVSSESSKQDGKSMPDTVIPRSSSDGDGGIGSFQLPESITGSASQNDQALMDLGDEVAFFPDVDFNFDAEGNLIELGAPELPVTGAAQSATRVRSDSMASERVRQEHDEGMLAGEQAVCELVMFVSSSTDTM